MSKLQTLYNRLEQRIYKFIKDDGVLDDADLETKVYKLQSMHSLVETILQEDEMHYEYLTAVKKQFTEMISLFELGEPEYNSEENVRTLLRQIRSGIKGIQTDLSLADLDSDDDIPEYLDEANEPFIDPESGECHYPTDLEVLNQIVWSYKTNRTQYKESSEFAKAADQLAAKMQNCSLKLKAEYEADLGDGLRGIANPAVAMSAELQAMRDATKRYFEPTHLATTAEVARVAEAFYDKQQVETDLCAGSLVIAASEALRSLHLLNADLQQHEAKLTWQDVELSLQRRPAATNLGNLFIRNIGCYGYREAGKKAKLNVLDDFANVTQYSGEDRLKDVIAKFGANPNKITCKMLKLPENAQGQKLLKKLKQNLFLIFCAEIFRYFPIEDTTTGAVKKIPFSVALSMGLEMLCSGEVELEELFDHDAPLGLPTGVGIISKERVIKDKLTNLIERYQVYLENSYHSVGQFKEVFPEGMVVSDSANHVEGLQIHFGRHLKPK
ncbi:MAG: hypothetical protein AB7I18_13980 [Candidatus Berkiella sp.]